MRSLLLVALAVLVVVLLEANALAGGFFHSVRDADTKKECGACHMAYPASLMPARSWELIIGSLDNHFGENAELPEPTRLKVLAYMTQNAGDSGATDSWFLRGLHATDTPARITDMPFWRSIHGGFPVTSFKRASVRAKSNCIGCHG